MRVSKETALLLKDKGYDLPCRQYYDMGKKEIQNTQENNPINWSKHDGLYSAPTLHEVADWLREAKGLHMIIIPIAPKPPFWIAGIIISDGKKTGEPATLLNESYDTHNAALEAGINHALKNYV